MGKIGENFGVEPDARSKDVGHAEFDTNHHKFKGRVVFRDDIVKDDFESFAVFTEKGLSVSQMTAAKVLDIHF